MTAGSLPRDLTCLVFILLSFTFPCVHCGGTAITATALADFGQVGKPQIRLALTQDSDLVMGGIMDTVFPVSYLLTQLMSAPNRSLLPDHDIAVDIITFTPGKAPLEVVGILSDDTPDYHGLIGPYWRPDAIDTVDLTARARILQMHGGDQPIFSNRTLYPYSFRTPRSASGDQSTMYFIAAQNGWHSMVSVWATDDLRDASNVVASRLNITNFPILSDHAALPREVEAWQNEVVTLIRSTRTRIVIVQITQEPGHQLICRVHRARISGLQYFVDKTWSPIWYLSERHPSLGDCTSDEMYTASLYQLQVFANDVAPGVNYLNMVKIPPVGGDQSQIPLTCMPTKTAQTYFNVQEHLQFAMQNGFNPLALHVGIYFRFAGLVNNALCSVLVAIHDALYNKGVSLESIGKREAHAFTQLTKSMEKVELQGAAGRFRFYNNTGDPEYTFQVIYQHAVPGRLNRTIQFTGIALFPNGPYGIPEISTVDENALPFVWHDGSTGLGTKPDLALLPDCGLQNGILVWDSCEPCPAGTAYDSLLQKCRTCPLGQFQNQTGMDHCEAALPGSYVVSVRHPSAIAPCTRGHECPQVGQVSPQACAKGRFASEPGQAECKLCPPGQFQDAIGSTACTSCEEVLIGGVTANIASTSPGECICPEGTFRDLGSDHCSPCPEGMQCAEGSDMRHLEERTSSTAEAQLPFPMVAYGYMTLESAPLRVYRCGADSHCPGGPPATCASGRDASTVACGDCADGAYESGEKCIECAGADILPLLSVCVAGVGLIGMVTIAINRDLHKTPAASMMIIAVSGLLFTSLQTMGVFSAMDVPWQEPVKTVLELTRILSFDLEVLKVSCVMGVNPIRSFALRQLLAVMVVPFVLLVLLIKKYAPCRQRSKTYVMMELCNTVGTFYSVFFISIVISAMDPFICYKHPGSSGESVMSAPSLLCFEGGDHAAMIIIGTVAMFTVPLPFWCLCLYGVVMYPRQIKTHNSGKFLHATRFLFFRYVPHRYYFHIFVLLRSLLVCLIPALLRGRPAAQVLFICMVLCAYAVALDTLKPWRVQHCNPLDFILLLSLFILLLCGSLFLEDQPQKEAIAALGGIVILASFLLVGAAFSYALFMRLAPSYFHFFICHHKGHAAAQSRYLKVLLQKRRNLLKVFIDSDNLQELDTLFDVVKTRVRHLVVLLTADTLKRPWCVGEIVTAVRTGITVTRLQTPSFAAPTDEQCRCPETYVDTTGCTLHEYGIQWEDITNALSVFLGTTTMEHQLNVTLPGTRRFEHAAAVLLKEHADDGPLPSLSKVRSGGMLVVTDSESDEASSAGGILLDRLAPQAYRTCEAGISLMCDHDEYTVDVALKVTREASVVMMVLSPGCLHSETYTTILCNLMRWQSLESSSAPAVISVNIQGFNFPSPAGIEKLCKSVPSSSDSCDNVLYMSAFFKLISIFLPTHAAQEALNTQADEIFHRANQGLSKRHLLSLSSSTWKVGSPGGTASPTGTASPVSMSRAYSPEVSSQVHELIDPSVILGGLGEGALQTPTKKQWKFYEMDF